MKRKGPRGNWLLALVMLVVIWTVVACAFSFLLGNSCFGQEPTPATPRLEDRETSWTKYLAAKQGWRDDVVAWDGSRPDLVTGSLAIEVDWAPKWAEGIGQAFDYSATTARAPAVLLLVKDRPAEEKHLYRAERACRRAGVRLLIYDCKADRWLNIDQETDNPLAETSSALWQWSPPAAHHAAVVKVHSGDGKGGSGVYCEFAGQAGVLTCAHVLGGKAMTVTFADGVQKTGEATHDKYGHDVAWVFVEHDAIVPVRLASSPPRPGDSLELASYGGPNANMRHFFLACQSDGAKLVMQGHVTPGDSGGPIFNAAGEVVGVQSTGETTVAKTSEDWPVYNGPRSAGFTPIRSFLGRVSQRWCPDGNCPSQPAPIAPHEFYPPPQPQPQPAPIVPPAQIQVPQPQMPAGGGLREEVRGLLREELAGLKDEFVGKVESHDGELSIEDLKRLAGETLRERKEEVKAEADDVGGWTPWLMGLGITAALGMFGISGWQAWLLRKGLSRVGGRVADRIEARRGGRAEETFPEE